MASRKINEFPAESAIDRADVIPKANPTTGVVEKITIQQLEADTVAFLTEGSANEVTKIWSGSQAQYDALTPVATTLYLITA